MKGDFSRNSFNPNKRYSSVRMQQGRVQLDADWNEQMDILEHSNRLITQDFLGTAAPHADAGFEIGNPLIIDSADFNIGAGRYYVNGLLAENIIATSFETQPDYPDAIPPDFNPELQNNIYLAYLEVWGLGLNAIDDPAIAEIALGGADTTIRVRNITQVKLLPVDWDGKRTPLTYATLFEADPTNPNAHNWNALINRLTSENISCLQPYLASSATLQNQLYRIEIHQGSQDKEGNPTTPTFKWSRDNASVSAKIMAVGASNITIANSSQDGQMSFGLNQWLELITPTRELTGVPGDMVEITAINGLVFTVSGTIGSDITIANGAIARRWDSQAVSCSAGTSLAIEDGLALTFSGTDFKTADYWMITARQASNAIEWPRDAETDLFLAQVPQGIERFYAPLAILKRDPENWERTDDCRQITTPINKLNVVGAAPDAPSGSIYVDNNGHVSIDQNSGGLSIKKGDLEVTDDVRVSGSLILDHGTTQSIINPFPVGTMIAYAGNFNPDLEKQGWLPCDGRIVNRKAYSKLFAAIGEAWGAPDEENIHLPQTQGLFLRGLTGETSYDPDVNDRTNLYPKGSTKNNVGSYQVDAFKLHHHRYFSPFKIDVKITPGNSYNLHTSANNNTETTGGNETRPKNVYVNYLIFVGLPPN
jgi:microcystin-dependent protein